MCGKQKDGGTTAKFSGIHRFQNGYFVKNETLFTQRIDKFFNKATEAFRRLNLKLRFMNLKEFFCMSDLLKTQLKRFKTIHFSETTNSQENTIVFKQSPSLLQQTISCAHRAFER